MIRNQVELPVKQFKTLLNGVIEQDKDGVIEGPGQMKPVTEKQPTELELRDLFLPIKWLSILNQTPLYLLKIIP